MVRKTPHSRHSTRRSLRRRRGPVPLADDSWDDTLANARPQLAAARRRRIGRYRWIIAAAGVGAIVALVTTLIVGPTPGFVDSGGDDPAAGTSTQDGAQTEGPGLAAQQSLPGTSSDSTAGSGSGTPDGPGPAGTAAVDPSGPGSRSP